MRTDDIDTVRLWCLEQVPWSGLPRHRVEPLVTGRHIDLVVVEAGEAGAEVRTTIARLRYVPNGRWFLYWRDGDGSFQVYRNLPAAEQVRDLLDFLAGDPDPLFWVGPDGRREAGAG